MKATVPSDLSNESIRGAAEALAELWSLHKEGDKADLSIALQKVNGTVAESDSVLGDESSEIDESGNFKVFLSRFSSSQRDRFTIAHELGHYFIHHYLKREKTLPVRFNRGASGPAETQANVFASSLLMPEKLFRNRYEQFDGDLSLLANAFDVSIAAADVRCKVLGLR